MVAIVHNILKLRQLPIDDMEKNYGEGKRGQYLEKGIVLLFTRRKSEEKKEENIWSAEEEKEKEK